MRRVLSSRMNITQETVKPDSEMVFFFLINVIYNLFVERLLKEIPRLNSFKQIKRATL